ncbi:glutathione S-transferase family protein [Brevundimonas sp. M20]|uniref:glutathione S-transferase family protein n=1 Tax=Brevundimonas sp. M20 TaxID=2591463 RepID=UPI001F0D659B|nr:glutathione binding-like protein [Brevundimonas sp. M20]
MAEGTALIPIDPFDRAKMFEWLFWEQYSHEPCIAVVRFQRAIAGRAAGEIDPRLIEKGYAALARMEAGLAGRDWLVGEAVSLADLALVAYTRVAHEGDFDLTAYPNVRTWVGKVEAAFGIA